jgi:hypothetical protein
LRFGRIHEAVDTLLDGLYRRPCLRNSIDLFLQRGHNAPFRFRSVNSAKIRMHSMIRSDRSNLVQLRYHSGARSDPEFGEDSTQVSADRP